MLNSRPAPTPVSGASSSGLRPKRSARKPTNGKRGGQPRNSNARTHGMHSSFHPSALTGAADRLSVLSTLAQLPPRPRSDAKLPQDVHRSDILSDADLLLDALRELQAAVYLTSKRAGDRQDYAALTACLHLSGRISGQINNSMLERGWPHAELEKTALASFVLPLWQFKHFHGITRDADEDYSKDSEGHSFPVVSQKSGQKSGEPPSPRRRPYRSDDGLAPVAISPELACLWWMDARREPEFEPLQWFWSPDLAQVTYYMDATDEYGWFTDRQWQLIAPLLPSQPPLRTLGERASSPQSGGRTYHQSAGCSYQHRPLRSHEGSEPAPRGVEATSQPLGKLRGRPAASSRAVLSAIFWKLSNAASWDDLPDHFPAKRTCRRYYKRWFLSGRLMTIYKVLMRDLLTRGRVHPFDFVKEGYFWLDSDHRIRTAAACPDTWQTRTALLFMQQSYALIRRIRREEKDAYFPQPPLHGKLREHYFDLRFNRMKMDFPRHASSPTTRE